MISDTSPSVTSRKPSHLLFSLPPEIRTSIYSYVLSQHFASPPFRELRYTASPETSWNLTWRSPLSLSYIPPFERVLIPYRDLFREFFSLRIAQSTVIFRPSERHNTSIIDADSGDANNDSNKTIVQYPRIGKDVSPLVVRSAREIQYLTYVYNPLLEEICIDQNEVSLELGQALSALASATTPHTPTLRSLTIVFRTPYYALYQRNYKLERSALWDGLKLLIKNRGVHSLTLKRDDGRGWRGDGPDFGELGEGLARQIGRMGMVNFVDDYSNIKYNRIAFPFTGIVETWEAPGGNRLVWLDAKEGINDSKNGE